MTSQDPNTALNFSDAVVSLMLGRAIAEGLSDVVAQPLPDHFVILLSQIDSHAGTNLLQEHGAQATAGIDRTRD